MSIKSKRLRAGIVAVMGTTAFALAGCGGQSESSDGASGSASPTEVYAEGVPTLKELYASTETEPPSTGPRLQPGKSIIFVSCGQSAPGCSGPAAEMKKIAEQVGWKYKIIDGANNVNNGWAAGVRQAIAAKPDGIVVTGMACTDVKQPLLEAKQAKIPVVALESIDCDDPKNEGGADEPLFTVLQFNEDARTAGEFYRSMGELQAAYVVNALQGEGKILRTVYNGVLGAYELEGQDEFLKKCEACEVAGEVTWNPQDANVGGLLDQRFRTLLVQHPDADATILNLDSIATSAGLSKAIVDAGRADKMFTIAAGGTSQALQLVTSNAGLTADLAYSNMWLAWGGVDTLNRVLNGSPAVPQGIGIRLVDKANGIESDAENYDSPVDYRSVYLQSWGVA